MAIIASNERRGCFPTQRPQMEPDLGMTVCVYARSIPVTSKSALPANMQVRALSEASTSQLAREVKDDRLVKRGHEAQRSPRSDH